MALHPRPGPCEPSPLSPARFLPVAPHPYLLPPRCATVTLAAMPMDAAGAWFAACRTLPSALDRALATILVASIHYQARILKLAPDVMAEFSADRMSVTLHRRLDDKQWTQLRVRLWRDAATAPANELPAVAVLCPPHAALGKTMSRSEWSTHRTADTLCAARAACPQKVKLLTMSEQKRLMDTLRQHWDAATGELRHSAFPVSITLGGDTFWMRPVTRHVARPTARVESVEDRVQLPELAPLAAGGPGVRGDDGHILVAAPAAPIVHRDGKGQRIRIVAAKSDCYSVVHRFAELLPGKGRDMHAGTVARLPYWVARDLMEVHDPSQAAEVDSTVHALWTERLDGIVARLARRRVLDDDILAPVLPQGVASSETLRMSDAVVALLAPLLMDPLAPPPRHG